MNYWLISDTHFNHEKIEQWGGRSGNWQERLWKGLESIPHGDVLLHLGDVCIGNDLDIHSRIFELPCKNVLVLGNHDKKSKEWYMQHGWDFVCDGTELIYMGEYLWLSHRPQSLANMPYRISRNIHGHTHGNLHRSEEYIHYYDEDFHKDISPELVGYEPIRLDTLIKSWKKHNKSL